MSATVVADVERPTPASKRDLCDRVLDLPDFLRPVRRDFRSAGQSHSTAEARCHDRPESAVVRGARHDHPDRLRRSMCGLRRCRHRQRLRRLPDEADVVGPDIRLRLHGQHGRRHATGTHAGRPLLFSSNVPPRRASRASSHCSTTSGCCPSMDRWAALPPGTWRSRSRSSTTRTPSFPNGLPTCRSGKSSPRSSPRRCGCPQPDRIPGTGRSPSGWPSSFSASG